MAESDPMVSVVIPVLNEAGSIRRTIDSILAQDYNGKIEVVISDGMSTDGTRDQLDEICGRYSQIRYVDNPSGRTPNGLNIAIGASRGEVIVRCDGHAELPPDYIRRAVRIMKDTGAVNVGGIQDAIGITPMQRAIAYAMSSTVGVGDARFHYGGAPGEVDTVYLGVFRRDALIAAGLFNEGLTRNQDYELNIRLRSGGGKIWFDPVLRVVYRPRRNLRSLWRQYFQYGMWKRKVISMHPTSIRLRQLVPPLFIIAMVGSVALLLTPWLWAGLVIPALYIGLLLFATVARVIRAGDPAALLLPAALVTMHTAWGIGFLSGK